jgi:TDG/mug DNA glycosylase family protein
MSSPVRSLPTLLRPGLRLVFIGYNPGIESARQGHYYAFRGNVFWRQMYESGLVAEHVTHLEDRRLFEEPAIGFIDLCPRPTPRAEHLSREEIIAGSHRLLAELERYQPAIAVFSGRGIYQHFGRHALGLALRDLAARPYGEQPERIGHTRPWLIPSSSGLASRWHRQRLDLLQQLARELNGHPDG